MARPFINTKKIQNGTRKLALLLSDSAFITANKVRQAAKAVFKSDDTKEKREFITQLAELLRSDSPTVRLAVVEALERVSHNQAQTAEDIRTTLEMAINDTDATVRQAAEAALKQA